MRSRLCRKARPLALNAYYTVGVLVTSVFWIPLIIVMMLAARKNMREHEAKSKKKATLIAKGEARYLRREKTGE